MGRQSGQGEVGRLVLEGLVVLLSILTAFALDAWWDGAQSARALSQDLDGVTSELENNREFLLEEIDALQRIMDGSESMLSILETQRDHETVVVVDTLAFLVSNWAPTLNTSFGALDALIESGRLGEIDDLALRSGLAGLKERVAGTVEQERLATDLLNNHLFPLLSSRVELGELARIDLEFFTIEAQVGQAIPSYGVVPYPNSMDIRNTIRFRSAWVGSALSRMSRLESFVDDLFTFVARNE
jgi:hypothetical protein